MVATVRLDKDLEFTLDKISQTLHKKRSDVIRDAISFYAQNIEASKKNKILKSIEKTKDIDKKEFTDFEDTFNDGI